MNYDYFYVSEKGQIRSQNEDAIGIFHTNFGLLVVVCDGLGGNTSGEFASIASLETIYRAFIESKETDLLQRIRKSIEQANSYIYEKSTGNLFFKGMATTCEVLLLNGVTAYWGHIGDSRIYILKKGKIKQLTKDHSLTQKMLDEGKLTSKDYKANRSKNVITKAIGDDLLPEIDTSKLILPDKISFKFFLCTDGVTCVLDDSELENILDCDNLKECSDLLANYIEMRGAPDNYTFAIVSK